MEENQAQEVTTAFRPYLEEITLVNGEKLQLPRLTGKKILATSNSVAKLIRAVSKEMPDKLVVEANSPRYGMDLVALIFDTLPTAMDHVIPLVSAYLGKSADEIGDWDAEDIISVVAIFFVNSLRSGNTLLNRLGLSPQSFVNFVQAPDQNPSIPSQTPMTPTLEQPGNSLSSSMPSDTIIDGAPTPS